MEFTSFYWQVIRALADKYGADLSTPFNKLPKKFKDILLYGTGDEKLEYDYTNRAGYVQHRSHAFEGLINNLERRYRETGSDWIKEKMEAFMSVDVCPSCHGKRLRPELLAVTVGGKNIMEFCDMSVIEAIEFIDAMRLSGTHQKIAEEILKEIRGRLQFLAGVGLDYLTLSRASATLSGGESQRIRLATQIGSGLVGVLYILDEPSIGLHQKDNHMLLQALRRLTDLGNTLLVVEHDEETMYAADQIIDIGPGAGVHGGELVAQGSVDDIKACERSITGQFLSGKRSIGVPHLAAERATGNTSRSSERRRTICRTSMSDSPWENSSASPAYPAPARAAWSMRSSTRRSRPGSTAARISPASTKRSKGSSTSTRSSTSIRRPSAKRPGRIRRPIPAYSPTSGTCSPSCPRPKIRGYGKGRFSFNVKGGRCEACRGDGIIKIEMHFLPDVYVPCEVCKGRRYNRETLEVRYKGKSIYDVLNMNVSEALEFFRNHPPIARQLQTLEDVGLGYIKLGQPSTQLSGGEAQRIKLATELSKRSTGNTLYILDEPTTGLHFADVEKLLLMLEKLVDAGNTVVVIEHNLDVIKRADHIIDLGPDGGSRGGTIVAEGTPEDIAEAEGSYTGQFLSKLLK